MKRLRKTFALAGVMTLFALPLTATPAAAAAGCHLTTCAGKTPASQGCTTDAYPIATTYVEDGLSTGASRPQVNLYYSPACQSVWGEYDDNDNDPNVQIMINTESQYGALVATPLLETPGEYVQTTMYSWDTSIRMCGWVGDDGCTGWR